MTHKEEWDSLITQLESEVAGIEARLNEAEASNNEPAEADYKRIEQISTELQQITEQRTGVNIDISNKEVPKHIEVMKGKQKL